MSYKYAHQGTGKFARAVALNQDISHKTAVMVANFVRGKTVEQAIAQLDRVLAMKSAIPFTRFHEGAGHKPGVGAGKFPQKATLVFKKTIQSAAANADDLGMDSNLRISSVTTHQGFRSMRYGRHRGRQRKSTHVEVIVEEMRSGKPRAKAKPATAQKKTEAEKPVEKTVSEAATTKKTTPKQEKKPAKKVAKKPAKKSTKKTTKKASKKPAKKATKKASKKAKKSTTEKKDGN